MKKLICFIISALLLFTACSTKPDDSDIPDEPELSIVIDSLYAASWTYPEDWNMLPVDERHVPEEILELITAKKLVELCLDLPEFGFLAKTSQSNFDFFAPRFNVIQHLLLSKEAGKYLIVVYKDAGMEGFRTLPYSNRFWPIKLMYIEVLLAQKEILQKLTPEERLELLLEARNKFNEKIGIYSSGDFNIFIMSRILAMEIEIEEYTEYIEKGYGYSPSIDEIDIMIDNYINKKK